MSPKQGRPYEKNSKKGRLEIRTSSEEEEMINYIIDKTGNTRADIIRQGMKEIYNNLKREEGFEKDYGELDNDIVLRVNIVCPYCDANNKINVYDYENDSQSYYRGENAMGDDVEHEIGDEAFQCMACGKIFSFSGQVWEYPVGVVNSKEIESNSLEDEV